MHSPFVYDFVTKVLKGKSDEVSKRIVPIRKRCLESGEVIDIEDFGAGYGGKSVHRIRKSLKAVMRSSGRGEKEGELLYRICARYKPKACLELGTNLGFSTIYQFSAVPDSRFVTVEGSQNLLSIARKNLAELNLDPETVWGEFTDVLENRISWDSFKPDYVLIDGNHRYEPLKQYFNYLISRINDGGIVVIDDIYWSEGMTKAWKEIIEHPDVTVSIDLWHLGLCFIRRPQAKEHFQFRF